MSNVTVLVKLFDIVQIKPEASSVFGGSLMTVIEVKPWGVQGYISIPTEEGVREAYYRCKHIDYVFTGGTTPYVPDLDADVDTTDFAAPLPENDNKST